jgi:hypothetical protein
MKRDAAVKKGLDSDLVGGVEGNAVRSALFRGLEGQPQAGKALEIRLLEVEMAQGGEIEGQSGRRAARGKPARRGWAGACR